MATSGEDAEARLPPLRIDRHSLGAIKSIIYQSTRRRRDVVVIVSFSAPRQFYSERVARQSGFRELMDKAEALVAEGKGDELLFIGVGATPGLFTARTSTNTAAMTITIAGPMPSGSAAPCSLWSEPPNPNFSMSMPRRSSRRSAPRVLVGWSMAPITFITVTHESSPRLSTNGWSSFATEFLQTQNRRSASS